MSKPRILKDQHSPKPKLHRQSVSYPWGKISLLAILLTIAFILHLIVFSDVELLMTIPQKEIFLSYLKVRTYKLAALLVFSFIILYLVTGLVRRPVLGWVFNVFIWLFIFFYVAEIWFSVSPCSQGNGEAYVARIWFKKYWHVNRFGFRDRDFALDTISDKNILLYLGDSFAAGHGIRDCHDRSSDVLQEALGNDVFVINAGTNGAGTRRELEVLRRFPYRPRWVILTHVVNDFEDVSPPVSTFKNVYQNSNTAFSDWLYGISRNSVAMDLLYHMVKTYLFGLIASGKMEQEGTDVNTTQYVLYKDKVVLNGHLSDLDRGIRYITDTLQAQLVFVLYPEDGSKVVDTTDLYVNQVIRSHFEGRTRLHFLNVTPIYKDMRASARRVNMFDGHPSVRVNKLVADSLVQIIRRIEKGQAPL